MIMFNLHMISLSFPSACPGKGNRVTWGYSMRETTEASQNSSSSMSLYQHFWVGPPPPGHDSIFGQS